MRAYEVRVRAGSDAPKRERSWRGVWPTPEVVDVLVEGLVVAVAHQLVEPLPVLHPVE
jgi:hypothetical protein